MQYRLAFFFVAICATDALAQISTSASTSPAGFRGSASFGPAPPVGIRAMTGAPYSGEEVTEQVQTIEGVLAEGTRQTTTWPIDSQGNGRPLRAIRWWTKPATLPSHGDRLHRRGLKTLPPTTHRRQILMKA
jgi:hypothetical protein